MRTSAELAPAASVATAEPDTPVVVELAREDFREPLLYIIEPAAGNRIVTAIEVLSPDNKRTGPGRDSYVNKQEELWEAGTHPELLYYDAAPPDELDDDTLCWCRRQLVAAGRPSG